MTHGEPTAPITGHWIRAGEYPGLTKNPLDTKPGVITEVSFKSVRIELIVTFEERPSEHWNGGIFFHRQDPGQRRPRIIWDAPWFHQNAGPQFGGGQARSMEVMQANNYDVGSFPGSIFLIKTFVEGTESGKRFESQVSFKYIEQEAT